MFLSSIGKELAALGVGLLVLAGSYMMGIHHGKADVQFKWDEAKQAQQIEVSRLQGELNAKAERHKAETAEIAGKLEQATQDFELSIVRERELLNRRLLNSEARAARYRSMSEADSADRAALASHAAELDRNLEEGRYLVIELRSVIEQHELRLKYLGQQLIEDRKIMEDAIITH